MNPPEELLPDVAAAPRRRDRRRAVRLALGSALVAGAAALVGRQLAREWASVAPTLAAAFHIDGRWLAATWLVQTAGGLVMVDTWRRIAAAMGVDASPAQHAQRYAFAALAHVVPGGIWTPLGRLAAYGRTDALAVGAAMTIEWVLLGVAGVVLYAASLPWALAAPPVGAAGVVAAAAIGLVAVQPPVFGRLTRLAGRLAPRSGGLPPTPARGALGGWLVRGAAVLVFSGTALYTFMRAVSPAASWPDAVGIGALTVALGNLLGPLPLTGLVKDLGMVLLLEPLYGSSAIALGLVVAWRLWMVAVELTWAALTTVWAARAADR